MELKEKNFKISNSIDDSEQYERRLSLRFDGATIKENENRQHGVGRCERYACWIEFSDVADRAHLTEKMLWLHMTGTKEPKSAQ